MMSNTVADEAALQTASRAGAAPCRSTVHGEFERIARRHPDRVAVRDTVAARTYSDVADRAAEVTAALTAAGVRPQQIVAVVGRRSLDLPALLVGILGAGAALTGCWTSGGRPSD